MAGPSPTVPPPSDDDHEDVAWALRAASAQWRRDDRADAISWVKRAAETAEEVGQVQRALELYHLVAYLSGGPPPEAGRSQAPGASQSPMRPVASSAPRHQAAIAPPPPSFGSQSAGEFEVDIEIDEVQDLSDDGLDMLDDEIVSEELTEAELIDEDLEEDEILVDDEIEELDQPPSSLAPDPPFSQSQAPRPSSSQPGPSMPPIQSRRTSSRPTTPHSSSYPAAAREARRSDGGLRSSVPTRPVEHPSQARGGQYPARRRDPLPSFPSPDVSDSSEKSAPAPASRSPASRPAPSAYPSSRPPTLSKSSQVSRDSFRSGSSRPDSSRPVSSRPGAHPPPSRYSSPPARVSSRAPASRQPDLSGRSGSSAPPSRSPASRPPAVARSSSSRPSGAPGRKGFDEAFLDSLEEEDAPATPGEVRSGGHRPAASRSSSAMPSRGSKPSGRSEEPEIELGELELGEGASSGSSAVPSAPLPSLNVAPAPSNLPMDASTPAEYAQHSQPGPYEQHDQIEEELGVDLSLQSQLARQRESGARGARNRIEPRREERKASPSEIERRSSRSRAPSEPDLSPTPGRVSVRPSAPSPVERSSSGDQPFPLAPSASAPPVAPVEPPPRASQAPPAESMEEPEAFAERPEAQDYELSGQVLGDHVRSPTPLPEAPSEDDDEDDILAGAFERIQSLPPLAPAEEKSEAPASRPSASEAPAPQTLVDPSRPFAGGSTVIDGTDLGDVPGLQDLPEDAQEQLVGQADVVTLAAGEEVSSFGVALVTAGAVQLMPTVSEASCARAQKGDVLFTKGTLKSHVALRVVAAEPESRVAVFKEADLDTATRSCPWVADELAEVADRYNAFAGAVLGPLGESLDEMFREMVFAKCSVKNPPAGTLIAEEGKPMDGMYILGAGSLEVLSAGDSVTSSFSPGDFVFPETVLSASAARSTVRVPKGGALLLYADRMKAHELLATCPPFIEILAG